MLVHNLPFYSVVFASPKMLFVEITICRATTYNRKKEKQRIGKEFRDGFDADLFLQNYMMPTASQCRKNCKAAKRQFQ